MINNTKDCKLHKSADFVRVDYNCSCFAV